MKIITQSQVPDVKKMEEPPKGSLLLYKRTIGGDIVGFHRRTMSDGMWMFPGLTDHYPWEDVRLYASINEFLMVVEP